MCADADLRMYKAVEDAELAVEQWLAAKRACALQQQQQRQELQATSAGPLPWTGLAGSSDAGAGPTGRVVLALDAAAGELARHTPLLVRLAFPAEHAAAGAAPQSAEAATAVMAPPEAAQAGAAAFGSRTWGGLRLEPGRAVQPASVPAALSRRARAALGYAAMAAGNPVLLVVCRWVLAGACGVQVGVSGGMRRACARFRSMQIARARFERTRCCCSCLSRALPGCCFVRSIPAVGECTAGYARGRSTAFIYCCVRPAERECCPARKLRL